LGYREYSKDLAKDCDVCGSTNCERSGGAHSPVREPWKGIYVDAALDSALDNFYSKIINVFVSSWFAPLSNDEAFLFFLRQNLREATCRLILKLQTLDIPVLITRKLLPMFFAHFEKINDMLVKDKVPMEKVVAQFLRHEYPVHPATINRQAEIEYLKKIVKILIPRLFTNDNFKSRVFFELIVEIFTFWTMLPLMDVISDPNLLNLLVVHATDKSQKRQKYTAKEEVVFLERFLKRGTVEVCEQPMEKHLDLLTDQIKLYSFMQFLKKEGAVDILRFYLDVGECKMT
jgi:PXA domain